MHRLARFLVALTLGLALLAQLSEDLDPVSGVMWGNFPQAYSHVGLIHAALAAAPRWTESG